MSPHRGHWVANITISRSNVVIPEGNNVSWPLPKKVNNDAALALMYILKREWVGALSLFPERSTE
jgi:hypothetical protein